MTIYAALICVLASLILGLKGMWRIFGALFILAILGVAALIHSEFGTLSQATWVDTGGDRDLGPGFAVGFFAVFFVISLLTFLIGLSIRGIVGQLSGMRK